MFGRETMHIAPKVYSMILSEEGKTKPIYPEENRWVDVPPGG